ncbi:hypothetical protein ACFVAF_34685 [Streptomyces sp. NPDC057596]|uniref:hypothetical protein n=1 Tax=unclassified Streptomyces TaxID=2593676 RepID=UPI0034361667
MTDHFPRPSARASSPGDARDLRNLLEAVADALTLPYDTDRYEQQLAERAGWALTTIRGALDEDPADIGWNADYLRSRFAPKQAAAERGERR